MTTPSAIPQQSNQAVDVATALSKLIPIFAGSSSNTTTSSSMDPTIRAQIDKLTEMLIGRGTDQQTSLINDIMTRAAQEFAPVIGAERAAGAYNSTVRKQLGTEFMSRATAAASSAVLQDQMKALETAAALSARAGEATKTTTTAQKTPPQMSMSNLLLSTVLGMGAKKVFGADKKPKTKGSDTTGASTAFDEGNPVSKFVDDLRQFVSGGSFGGGLGSIDAGIGAGTGGVAAADIAGGLIPQSLLSTFTASAGATDAITNFSDFDTGLGAGAAAGFGVEPLVSGLTNTELGSLVDQGLLVDMGAGAAADAGLGAADLGAFFDSGADIASTLGSEAAGAFVDVGGELLGDAAGGVPYLGSILNLAEGDVQGAAFTAIGTAIGGPIGGLIGSVVSSIFGDDWIICTELLKQGRLSKRWYPAGARVFASYPEVVKNGYYLWAIPSVQHLRKHPNSLYSRFLETIFKLRAENIAAEAGVRGARKLIRGALIASFLYYLCYFIGLFVGEQNWRSVYTKETA